VKASFGSLDGYFGKDMPGSTVALEDFGKTLDAVGSTNDTRSRGVFRDLFTGKLSSGVIEARNRLDELADLSQLCLLSTRSRRCPTCRRSASSLTTSSSRSLNNSGEFKNSLVAQANELGVTADKATLLALATGEMKGATSETAQGLSELSGSAADATVDIDELRAAIDGFGSAVLDVRSASRDLEAAMDDLAASAELNGSTLDRTTEKGRANEAALDAIAMSAPGVASATLEQTGSQEAASAALEDGRQKLIKALGQFGVTGAAAEKYADRLGLIPSNIMTAAKLTGAGDAESALQLLTRVRQVQIKAIIRRGDDATPQSGGTTSPGYAAGGVVYGPGSSKSDSIRALLSNGEHVWTAAGVKAAGGHAEVMALRRAVLAGPGLASWRVGLSLRRPCGSRARACLSSRWLRTPVRASRSRSTSIRRPACPRPRSPASRRPTSISRRGGTDDLRDGRRWPSTAVRTTLVETEELG
jgi:hypothetical protein